MYNLSALGNVDWAYWSESVFPASGEPTNRKRIKSSVIEDLSPVDGHEMMGSSSQTLPNLGFEYTDGRYPVDGKVERSIGVLNRNVNTVGAGLELSITLPEVKAYTVRVWAAGFDAVGRLTASLEGCDSNGYAALIADSNSNGDKDSYVYTLTATPDHAGDQLRIRIVLDSDPGNHPLSHLVICAVAVSAE